MTSAKSFIFVLLCYVVLVCYILALLAHASIVKYNNGKPTIMSSRGLFHGRVAASPRG